MTTPTIKQTTDAIDLLMTTIGNDINSLNRSQASLAKVPLDAIGAIRSLSAESADERAYAAKYISTTLPQRAANQGRAHLAMVREMIRRMEREVARAEAVIGAESDWDAKCAEAAEAMKAG